jgi:hypothetical protein
VAASSSSGLICPAACPGPVPSIHHGQLSQFRGIVTTPATDGERLMPARTCPRLRRPAPKEKWTAGITLGVARAAQVSHRAARFGAHVMPMGIRFGERAMRDLLSKAEHYQKLAAKNHELAKFVQPAYLGDFYRGVAVRYAFMAQEASKLAEREVGSIAVWTGPAGDRLRSSGSK